MQVISLSPEYWGAGVWRTMFSIAYTYPPNPTPDQKIAANNYFNSLKWLLPCSDCREHYTDLLKTRPVEPHTASKISLLKWLEGISNEVNKMLEKEPIQFQKLYAEMEKVKSVHIPDASPPETQPAEKPEAQNPTPQAAGQPNPTPQPQRRPLGPLNRGVSTRDAATKPAAPARKRGCGCGKNRKK